MSKKENEKLRTRLHIRSTILNARWLNESTCFWKSNKQLNWNSETIYSDILWHEYKCRCVNPLFGHNLDNIDCLIWYRKVHSVDEINSHKQDGDGEWRGCRITRGKDERTSGGRRCCGGFWRWYSIVWIRPIRLGLYYFNSIYIYILNFDINL